MKLKIGIDIETLKFENKTEWNEMKWNEMILKIGIDIEIAPQVMLLRQTEVEKTDWHQEQVSLHYYYDCTVLYY